MKKFNPRAYGELLAETLPAVITSRAEYDRVEAIVNKFLDKGEDNLSPEEFKLYDLLGGLLEDYERRTLPALPEVTPTETLKFLMTENGLKQGDLADIFGSQSVVSEVLNGKRSISAAQAKKLGERFSLSPAAFI